MLEVCIDSLESATNAVYGGADEIEVCSCLNQGGLTPSAGLVRKILGMVDQYMIEVQKDKKALKRPKVNAMIRCRAGSDFCYSYQEMETMVEDIRIFKDMGVDRLVFGCLTVDQEISLENCRRVVSVSHPIPVTFHRAFDLTKDPMVALNTIQDLGFTRLLTSGQQPVAHNENAIQLISDILKKNNGKIQIMPGAGISVANVKKFVEIGCEIVHSSCKVARVLPAKKNYLDMGDVEHDFVTSQNVVMDIKKVINSCLIKD